MATSTNPLCPMGGNNCLSASVDLYQITRDGNLYCDRQSSKSEIRVALYRKKYAAKIRHKSNNHRVRILPCILKTNATGIWWKSWTFAH